MSRIVVKWEDDCIHLDCDDCRVCIHSFSEHIPEVTLTRLNEEADKHVCGAEKSDDEMTCAWCNEPAYALIKYVGIPQLKPTCKTHLLNVSDPYEVVKQLLGE